MNIAFLCVGFSLALIGYSYYEKSKKLPQSNEAEIKEFKKTKEIGISFMFSGLAFFLIGISKVF